MASLKDKIGQKIENGEIHPQSAVREIRGDKEKKAKDEIISKELEIQVKSNETIKGSELGQNNQDEFHNNKKIKLIPVEKLIENPLNETIFNMDISSLLKVIRENGFQGTIEVYDLENGTYEISSGHRRFRAAKECGIKEIPCYILDKPQNETESKIRLLESNLTSRKLSPLDYARSITFYMNEVLGGANGRVFGGGGKRQQAADFFEISDTKAKRYISILNLPEELQQYADIIDFPYDSLQEARDCTPEEIKRIKELIDEENPLEIKASRVKKIINLVKMTKKESDNQNNENDKKMKEREAYKKHLKKITEKIKSSEAPLEYIENLIKDLEELKKSY